MEPGATSKIHWPVCDMRVFVLGESDERMGVKTKVISLEEVNKGLMLSENLSYSNAYKITA